MAMFGGVGDPILFGNDLLWNNLPYSKGFMKFSGLSRLEIYQKIYTTIFSDQKFYTQKVPNLRLFLLKKKQCNFINLVVFFVRIELGV